MVAGTKRLVTVELEALTAAVEGVDDIVMEDVTVETEELTMGGENVEVELTVGGEDVEDIVAEDVTGLDIVAESTVGEVIIAEVTEVESGARSKSSSAWVDTSLSESSESLPRELSEWPSALSPVEHFLSLTKLLDIFLMLPLILALATTWVSRNWSRLVTTRPLRWKLPLVLPSWMHWMAVDIWPRIRIL